MNPLKPAALCLAVSSLALAGPKGPADLAATAQKVIVEIAGVKEKEVVALEGDPADQALLEELFVAVGRQGGSPLLRVAWPNLQKRWLLGVPDAKDAARLVLEEKLLPLIDVVVAVERADEPGFFKEVSAARRAAFRGAMGGLDAQRMKRKLRMVWLGNGLSPSKANAKALGLSEAELSATFWAGVATDPQGLAKRGEAVKAAVPAGKELVITNPAGTRLTLKLGAKPMAINDGVITPEEAKAGGPGTLSWLPAGEAYGLVEAGSAEGKVVVPRFTFEGEELKDLTLEVKAGKVTALSAKPSKAFDALKAFYDAAGGGKDMLTVLDFGLNPDVKAPKGLLSYVPAGNVTLFLGGDVWAGGTNPDSFGMGVHLTDATVVVAGATVVEKGALKVAATK